MSTEAKPEIPQELFGELDAHYDALEAEHAPDDYSTVGLLAVKGDLARAVIVVHAEPWHESELSDVDKYMARYLQETRDRLADIDRDHLLLIGSRAMRSTMPQFLLDTLAIEYEHQVLERLTERTPDGSPAVQDATMLNFLQWHSYKMIGQRERFMERELPRLREGFVSSLQRGAKQGWIPADALDPERLKALDSAEVIIDDGVFLHEVRAGAYVVANDNRTAPEVHLPPYTPQKTANHEFSHVIAGVRLSKGKAKGRFSGELENEGLYRLFDKEQRSAGKVIDEAVTEHIALNLEKLNPDPSVINPDVVLGLFSSYYSERELLDVLCNGGVKPIDIQLFITAYFEDSSRLRQPALRTLKRSLTKAFPGRNIIGELGTLMSAGDYDEASKGLSEFAQSLRFNKYKNHAFRQFGKL